MSHPSVLVSDVLNMIPLRTSWVSSYGSDFNYDFNATTDSSVKPMEFNFAPSERKGENPGLSVFLLGSQGEIYHTYQTFARGTDSLLVSLQLLDYTPFGRQHPN